MSVVLSIITATDLLHVSDLPPEGPRTLVLRHPTSTGLLTAVGEAPPLDWLAGHAADPAHEAGALAQRLAARADLEQADVEAAHLLTGWGKDRQGRDHTFRFLISNLDGAGYTVQGESLTPDSVLKRGASAPYSVQVVATVEQPAAARRRVEALPRVIKRGDASGLALEAAAIVRLIVPGPVLVAHLTPDGVLEAAVLDGAQVTPVQCGAETGTARLAVASRPA